MGLTITQPQKEIMQSHTLIEEINTSNNYSALHKYLESFRRLASERLTMHFSAESLEVSPMLIFNHPGFNAHTFTPEESLLLLCAFIPHIQPGFYDALIQQYLPEGGDFAGFGGVKGANTRYMLPTGDTALFLLAGEDAQKRETFYSLFSANHWFWKEKILWLEPVKEGEPRFSGRLIISAETVELLTEGTLSAPAFSADFPAQLLHTEQLWDDLVLNEATLEHINDVRAWLYHHTVALQDPVLHRKTKPGYRALFYGPSGTGKTLAATLLGQELNREVYRIDLSQVVSKYIGETEKNLEKVFSKAAHRNWILFFDEADALFGKRSNVQSSHDKYANQEVSYLLQRVEDFPGLIILASNFKSNIDAAFLRRFSSIIEFPFPKPAERLKLWEKAMPEKINISAGVNLTQLAEKYELSGSTINQVVYYASLQMYHLNLPAISQELLIQGIQRELKKEDKVLR
jgi:hypothetical protein